ncbi:hypothetical protein AB3S75_028267 [Citrus x aurantiifolia]
MEPWSYGSEGKGAVANDRISPADSSSRSKGYLMGWELNTSCHNMLVSHREAPGNQSFGEFGIQEFVGKRLTKANPIKDVLSSKNHFMNPNMPTPNTSFGEDESTSKRSSSVVDSNSSLDSSLIDLNLGRFVDQRDSHTSKFSHGTPKFSSSKSSAAPKRVRLSGISSHTAYCQVYGCNKDLSSSKDYHKRHKVCEAHSKAAKVIVNEIEQRFCQQCSRFHFLDEFDDGKRSCRKRLAGHNERRRKPQVGVHPGRTAKLLRSHEAFAGCKFQGTTLPMSSFICPDILPGGIFYPEKCRTNDWCKCVKVEDMNDYNAVSATSISKGNLHPKSFFPQYDFQKVVPPFHGNEASAATESIFSATSARYAQDLGGPKSVSSPLFRDSSLGSEEFSIFDTPSTIQGLSRISECGYAHPLLSSKSPNSPSPLSGIPVARPLVIGGSGGAHYNISQVSEKLIGVSSQASTSRASNKFSLSGNNSFEGSNLGSILMSDSSDAANVDVSNRFYRGSDFMSSKDRLSCEDGATIDLLQLSSQLQRVEHQNQFMQVKDENDSFCCLRIT